MRTILHQRDPLNLHGRQNLLNLLNLRRRLNRLSQLNLHRHLNQLNLLKPQSLNRRKSLLRRLNPHRQKSLRKHPKLLKFRLSPRLQCSHPGLKYLHSRPSLKHRPSLRPLYSLKRRPSLLISIHGEIML